jgi:hypothetical protein
VINLQSESKSSTFEMEVPHLLASLYYGGLEKALTICDAFATAIDDFWHEEKFVKFGCLLIALLMLLAITITLLDIKYIWHSNLTNS